MNLLLQNKLSKQIIFLHFLMSLLLVGCTNNGKKPNHLSIHPQYIHIGKVQHIDIIPLKINLSNNSEDSITLLGISESCTCIYDSIQLPVVIKPNESKEVSLFYQNKDTSIHGSFSQKIVVHTLSDSIFQQIQLAGTLE